MGIFGALSTAVSGLQAQSYAIENISGNIANSQTVGFKRVDTSFNDLIPDTPPNQPLSGSTQAFGVSTLAIQGEVQSTGINTNMAINGSGMFIVGQQVSQSDGNPVFAGSAFYTRRGDFTLDQNGFLQNGSGYFLEGLPIDPKTGNTTGSVPAPIQVSTAFQPASPTTEINYQANLAEIPQTASQQPNQPNSDLLQVNSFSAGGNPLPTSYAGTQSTITAANAFTNINLSHNAGDQLNFDVVLGSTTAHISLTQGLPADTGNHIYTIDEAISAIQTQLNSQNVPVTVGKDNTGTKLTFTANAVGNTPLTVNNITAVDGAGGGALQSATDLGVSPTDTGQTGIGTPVGNGVVLGSDATNFISQSIEGGGISVFDSTGATLNVQFRWAKVSNTPGSETWNLFYLSNSNATGNQPAWINVGQNYVFNSSGQLNPPITSVSIPNFTVNGSNLGTIILNHGENGVTQFQDPSGTAQVTTLDQNGFPAGQLSSIAVDNSSGTIVGTYSNGRTQKLAQIVLADFKGLNFLQPVTGGAYAVTQSSGAPILGATGSIVGGSVEASNTDIADEFTQLIVTQQAYTANTRVVTTSNQMLQDALNILR